MTTARAMTFLLVLFAAFVDAGCSPDRARRASRAPAARDVGMSAEQLASERLKAAVDEIGDRDARIGVLTVELVVARRDVDRLTTLNTAIETDLADLRAEFADTRRVLHQKESLIQMAESSGVSFGPMLLPEVPRIDGAVVAIDGAATRHRSLAPSGLDPRGFAAGSPIQADTSPALVTLSVGADDKVDRGYQFSIYRGNQFVGKVVVEHVLRDTAGCRVLFVADRQEIRRGDLAATRLQ